MFRQNLGLKLVALLVSVVLYTYVQAERNPVASRTLVAPVQLMRVPPGVEVENPEPQSEVSVSGPKAIVDRVKDGDIIGVADLDNAQTASSSTLLVRVRFAIPQMPPEMQAQLAFDPPSRSTRMRIFAQQTRTFLVQALYPHDPPAGFRYGAAAIMPSTVKVRGRSDKVSRVSAVVVNAEPAQTGATINGDFNVSCRDQNNEQVDSLDIQPLAVHVNVPLVDEPSSKTVTVSVNWTELPPPPYKIAAVSAVPAQVRIFGKPARLSGMFTIKTEDIPAADFTTSRNVQAILDVPPDVIVRDLDGKPLTHVTVHFEVTHAAPPSPAPTQTGSSPPAPVH